MNSTSEDSDFVLPSGDDLRVFLNQDSISTSLFRRVLRHRGVFMSSTDKKDLLGYFLLSFLSPDEIQFLLDCVRTKEDSQKVRSHTHSINCDNKSLAEMLPTDLNFHKIVADPYGNSQTLGSPTFIRDPEGKSESHVLRYKIERMSIAADWIRARRVFDGEIRYTLNLEEKRLDVTTLHTATEIEKANRRFTGHVQRELKKNLYIDSDEEARITFGSFSNQQRVLFFMKFTAFNEHVGITFKKLTDLSLRLDEAVAVPDEERLNWMRNKVKKLRLNGDALQETFFVTDKNCRPYVIFWKSESSYVFETADESGTFGAVFEFADYAINELPSCEFQISISTLSIDGKQQTHPDCLALKKQFVLKLNRAKAQAFKDALGLVE